MKQSLCSQKWSPRHEHSICTGNGQKNNCPYPSGFSGEHNPFPVIQPYLKRLARSTHHHNDNPETYTVCNTSSRKPGSCHDANQKIQCERDITVKKIYLCILFHIHFHVPYRGKFLFRYFKDHTILKRSHDTGQKEQDLNQTVKSHSTFRRTSKKCRKDSKKKYVKRLPRQTENLTKNCKQHRKHHLQFPIPIHTVRNMLPDHPQSLQIIQERIRHNCCF